MEKTCPICGGEAKKTAENIQGYTEGTTYTFFECSLCESSFSDPLISDNNIYNHIYSQAEIIPGYERYIRYSKLVKQVSSPLDALSNAENSYWAIREALRINFPDKEDIQIIEIGSGLGYLTYSLNNAGYVTKGIDISETAVKKATKNYGQFYEAGDVVVLAEKYKRSIDAVIMTEIIEHVEDPKKFISAALLMLKKGGKLILTTPNKTWTPKGYVWGSDVPPIHLWWFSEKSIKSLALQFSKECYFIDFTGFTSRFHEPLWYPTLKDIQADVPKINKQGNYIGKEKVENFKSRFFSIKVRYVLSYVRRRLKSKNINARTSTLCAVIIN